MLKLVGMGIVAGFVVAPSVHADIRSTLTDPTCHKYIQQTPGVNVPGCSDAQSGVAEKGGLANEIADTLLFAAGLISFIFVLIGGFRYITATGDSGRIQSAKDTLLYAVLGLIISVIAFPIVGFVIKKAGG